MKATEKLIEVKFNKEVWEKNKIKVLETMLLSISLIAAFLLIFTIAEMIKDWSISNEQLTTSLVCLVWLGGFSLYGCLVSR